MQIWKYPIPQDLSNTYGEFELKMPDEADVLYVALQGGQPTMWVLVDPDKTKSTREFKIVGTGHEFAALGQEPLGTFQWEYLGTYQLPPFVWHVFGKVGPTE